MFEVSVTVALFYQRTTEILLLDTIKFEAPKIRNILRDSINFVAKISQKHPLAKVISIGLGYSFITVVEFSHLLNDFS